ncbi:hypothetical protein Bbelb_190750 [Branchiostoma belcheri]|nr:hypothetical protein Bbelb_190750 [Branchiostoma belcheri]
MASVQWNMEKNERVQIPPRKTCHVRFEDDMDKVIDLEGGETDDRAPTSYFREYLSGLADRLRRSSGAFGTLPFMIARISTGKTVIARPSAYGLSGEGGAYGKLRLYLTMFLCVLWDLCSCPNSWRICVPVQILEGSIGYPVCLSSIPGGFSCVCS